MNNFYESDISDDLYDILFNNTQHKTIDFCAEFDRAYVDRDNACIYLLDSSLEKPQFKLRVERMNHESE